MKARSNCSTWDSRDSELLRRQQLLLACSTAPGPGAASRTTPAEAGAGCHGQTAMGTSPNRKKRWLGDLKDKSLHRVVLFIQDYHYNLLHIVLQQQRWKNSFVKQAVFFPQPVCFTYFWHSDSMLICCDSQHQHLSKANAARLFLLIRKNDFAKPFLASC